eukprot:TRINITY_DN14872_c0_g1_i1.p1 TRINITY_DN14872_c0_g1~~TRINITY_DN14872_c0_g1_i1.p1  ORF type:complete len:266 (-),score=22.86 TRINITY_DN14872_c0_g1_i1:164-961(-)
MLDGKWLYFYGDSRVRILYAALLSLLTGRHVPSEVAHHDACPFDDRQSCGKYYEGEATDVMVGNIRVTYEVMRWANERPQSRSFAHLKRQPDVMFVCNGAWSVYYEKYGPMENPKDPFQFNTIFGVVKPNHETDTARLGLFQNIGEVVGNRTWKIKVGYPHCTDTFSSVYDEQLRQEGWLIYDVSKLTDSAYWAGFTQQQAWNAQVLPKQLLPSVNTSSPMKRPQCEGPHTWDTLTDLEWQLMLNAILVPGEEVEDASVHDEVAF